MIQQIMDRRSIRRFRPDPVAREAIVDILQAGILAPSSKNRQPWRFVVAQGAAKEEALQAMERGLERERRAPLLPNNTQHISGAEHTLKIMRQAPTVIFVANALGAPLDKPLTPEDRIGELCNAQSIGAALENMSLEAVHLGLGSLWICDTCFAQEELQAWLGTAGELCAAFAVGYPAESPSARPRMGMESVTEWRG